MEHVPNKDILFPRAVLLCACPEHSLNGQGPLQTLLAGDRTSLLRIAKTAETVADESSVPIDLASVLVTRPGSSSADS